MSAWNERDERRHYSQVCFDGVHDKCRANACICGCHGPESWQRNSEVASRIYARRRFLAQLSADGPVIVVDGKVVELSIDGDVAEWLEDACATAGISLDAFAYVIDAAREVEK